MVKIKGIRKGSIAEKMGIKKGSYLISIDGKEINDSLDLRFFESCNSLELSISMGREEKIYHIKKDADIPLGIKPTEFETKICTNNCTFCFVNQNPPDVREALLIKDDDYRLSFLYGSYITLTNLTDKDFKRIIELKLSPLYISVHATNPEKRVELMKNPLAGRILEDIKRLTGAGIKLHTQIVLLPDFNDGEYLNETIEDLLSFYPSIESIGIIPVGLTDFRRGLPPIKNTEPEWMNEIIKIVEPYQEEMLKKAGKAVVYLSDEFYLKTGKKVPPEEHYGEFPQLENGIGMIRQFLSGLAELTIPALKGKVLLVTGTLASSVIWELAKHFRESGIEAEVLPVRNRYFGGLVEVAGLLGGWDLMGVISVLDFDMAILPPGVVNSDGLFIDGCSFETFQSSIPLDVYIAPYDIRDLGRIF